MADLRIDRTQDRVAVHDDLLGRQSDERAARHGIVRHKHRYLRRMLAQGPGNLCCRQGQAAGCVQNEIDRHILLRHSDRPQNRFGIFDADIAQQGKIQQPHGLLPVHQQNDPAAALLFNACNQLGPARFQHTLAYDRLESRDEQKQPEDRSNIHPILR